MIIPHAQIDNETLESLIESVVLRDGTDYGDVEMSLTEKVELVKGQLKQGIAAIEYSEEHESINIISIG
jgi:uncharacterized protein YheU (UPF0270 family)